MSQLPLWVVLGVEVLFAMLSLAVRAHPDATAQVEARTRQVNNGCFLLFVFLGGTTAMAGAWIWQAFNTDDWRYAAVGLVPWFAGIAGQAVKAIQPKAKR